MVSGPRGWERSRADETGAGESGVSRTTRTLNRPSGPSSVGSRACTHRANARAPHGRWPATFRSVILPRGGRIVSTQRWEPEPLPHFTAVTGHSLQLPPESGGRCDAPAEFAHPWPDGWAGVPDRRITDQLRDVSHRGGGGQMRRHQFPAAVCPAPFRQRPLNELVKFNVSPADTHRARATVKTPGRTWTLSSRRAPPGGHDGGEDVRGGAGRQHLADSLSELSGDLGACFAGGVRGMGCRATLCSPGEQREGAAGVVPAAPSGVVLRRVRR